MCSSQLSELDVFNSEQQESEMRSHILRQLVRLAQRHAPLFRCHSLVIVNTVTCGLLLGAADTIQQAFEQRKKQTQQWDIDRTRRMFVTGCSMGPLLHYWYLWIDKIIPSKGVQHLKVVIMKVAIDQSFSPFFGGWYFIIMALLEGHSLADGIDEFRDKFWDYYLVELIVWPGAQLLNFLYFPSQYRVLFVNIVTLGWNVYLSYLKHRS